MAPQASFESSLSLRRAFVARMIWRGDTFSCRRDRVDGSCEKYRIASRGRRVIYAVARVFRDEASASRNGRYTRCITVYAPRKTVHTETLLTRNNSTIIRLISRGWLARCTPVRRCNIGTLFFRYREERDTISFSPGFSHHSIPWNSHSFRAKLGASVRRNRAAFSSICFITRNRSESARRWRGARRRRRRRIRCKDRAKVTARDV